MGRCYPRLRRKPVVIFETVVQAPIEDVWDFHRSAEALRLLTPPNRKVEVLGDQTEVVEGSVHRIRVRQFGVPILWVAKITEVRPPHEFVDVALKSPFKSWTHRHQFFPHEEGTLVRDVIDYELPLGPLGRLADRLFVRRDLERLFAYRHEVTKRTLEQARG